MNKSSKHTTKTPDWVVFDIPTSQCLCQHCGATLHLTLPQPIADLAKEAASFDRIHSRCPAPDAEVKK